MSGKTIEEELDELAKDFEPSDVEKALILCLNNIATRLATLEIAISMQRGDLPQLSEFATIKDDFWDVMGILPFTDIIFSSEQSVLRYELVKKIHDCKKKIVAPYERELGRNFAMEKVIDEGLW